MSLRDKCIALRKEIFRNKLNEARNNRLLYIKQQLMDKALKEDEFRQWEGAAESAVSEQRRMMQARQLEELQRSRRGMQETGVF